MRTSYPVASGRGVIGILGPTNTGKTHLAIERMAAHESGVIGLPLRLLAREVYKRLGEKVGVGNVALITGEERVNAGARYKVCTVEAMPAATDAAFVAIDEVQLAADFDRGHVFTDRILNLRGTQETLLLGAATIEQALRRLLPGLEVRNRPRMSVLEYSGSKKLTRLPPRSAIVAFSANEVYAIAELIKRQRGGAAVVMGALSPRTRNAQVNLYESGDVDFLVATDAIGMGLNLDLNHVAFAQETKFDGHQHRRLTAAEMAQIAGRAGRHTRNGTFGVTGHVHPLEDELVERLETHEFLPDKVLNWRNRELEFSSVAALKSSLEKPSGNPLLARALPASDQLALERLALDPDIAEACRNPECVALLWEVCQTPDYRKISPGAHAEMLRTIFGQLQENGTISEDWLSDQIRYSDSTTGSIDALSVRIAQIRSCTFLSHKTNWLENAAYWQEKARAVEDKLSDALHENLTKRFIDRRTSVLMKRLRENAHMEAEINRDGEVIVEGHTVGRLSGFRFVPDAVGNGPEAKAANAAAAKALLGEFERRSAKIAAAPNNDILLSSDGTLRWQGEPVARLIAGEAVLQPRLLLLADEQLNAPDRDNVVQRLERWVKNHTAVVLKPLVEMGRDQTLEGMARGIAFRMVEALGILDRRDVASDIQGLDQEKRAELRRHGVRFGFYNVFIPALLKPAPAELLCLLWSIHHGKMEEDGRVEIPAILASGRTSTDYNPAFLDEFYRLCGYRILGPKAVRIDILERLADLIRPALFWKGEPENRPEGAIEGHNFVVTPAMMSILGASHEDMEAILQGLGYRSEKRLASEVLPTPEKPDSSEELGQADKASGLEIPASDSIGKADENVNPVPAEETTPSLSAEADPPTTQPVESEKQSENEPQEPDHVLVWRPAAKHQNRRKPGNQDHKAKRGVQKPRRKDDGQNKEKKPDNKATRKKNEKRKDNRVDPDSPFAKLEALKKQMGNG